MSLAPEIPSCKPLRDLEVKINYGFVVGLDLDIYNPTLWFGMPFGAKTRTLT